MHLEVWEVCMERAWEQPMTWHQRNEYPLEKLEVKESCTQRKGPLGCGRSCHVHAHAHAHARHDHHGLLSLAHDHGCCAHTHPLDSVSDPCPNALNGSSALNAPSARKVQCWISRAASISRSKLTRLLNQTIPNEQSHSTL